MSGEVAPIDMLFSFGSQEFIFFDLRVLKDPEPLIKPNWKDTTIVLPYDDLNAIAHPNEFRDALEKLRIAYYTNATSTPDANIALMSDLIFGYSVLKNVIYQAIVNTRPKDKNQYKNTFYFRNSMNNDQNAMKLVFSVPYTGSVHGDDVCLIFHCHLADTFNLYDKCLENRDSAEFKSIMRFVTLITNFARTGNPSIEGDTPFKSCTSEQILCQDISNDPKSRVMDDMKQQLHYDTWRAIEQDYNELMEKTKI